MTNTEVSVDGLKIPKIYYLTRFEKSDVYITPFKDNNTSKTYTYVGMITRILQERTKEHMADIK